MDIDISRAGEGNLLRGNSLVYQASQHRSCNLCSTALTASAARRNRAQMDFRCNILYCFGPALQAAGSGVGA